jgi:hypothetical protein
MEPSRPELRRGFSGPHSIDLVGSGAPIPGGDRTRPRESKTPVPDFLVPAPCNRFPSNRLMSLARPKAIACPHIFIRLCADKRELSTMTADSRDVLRCGVLSADKLRIPSVHPGEVKSSFLCATRNEIIVIDGFWALRAPRIYDRPIRGPRPVLTLTSRATA